MTGWGFEVYDTDGTTIVSRSRRYPRRHPGCPMFIDRNANDNSYFPVQAPATGALMLVFQTGGGGMMEGGWKYRIENEEPYRCWLYGTKLLWDYWDSYRGQTSHSMVGTLPGPTLDNSAGPTSGTYPSVSDPNNYGDSPSARNYPPEWVNHNEQGITMHVIAYG